MSDNRKNLNEIFDGSAPSPSEKRDRSEKKKEENTDRAEPKKPVYDDRFLFAHF